MRTAVALVTTFATVLHLAVGCCGHLSHFDGGSACCGGNSVSDAAVECCADHDHDHEVAPTSPGRDGPEASGVLGASVVRVVAHDCGRCMCVAKIDQDQLDDATPPVSSFLALVDSDTIVMAQAARGPCEAWDPPVPSELRPPLFERLVV